MPVFTGQDSMPACIYIWFVNTSCVRTSLRGEPYDFEDLLLLELFGADVCTAAAAEGVATEGHGRFVVCADRGEVLRSRQQISRSGSVIDSFWFEASVVSVDFISDCFWQVTN
jgi:hypothetical protein